MKYREDLVEKVRKGKAQVQVDSDPKWKDLLKHIFPERKGYLPSNYYVAKEFGNGLCYGYLDPQVGINIIHAKDFVIEREVEWVEVNRYKGSWVKRILLADLGEQVLCRYVTVEGIDEQRFINGEKFVGIDYWDEMRPIQEPEELTHKQLEELIGKPFRYKE